MFSSSFLWWISPFGLYTFRINMKPWTLQKVGRALWKRISPSWGRYLHRATQTQNKRKNPYFEWDSNPRSQCPTKRNYFSCLTARPLCSAPLHRLLTENKGKNFFWNAFRKIPTEFKRWSNVQQNNKDYSIPTLDIFPLFKINVPISVNTEYCCFTQHGVASTCHLRTFNTSLTLLPWNYRLHRLLMCGMSRRKTLLRMLQQ
jgi:hypothetical protein